MGAARTLAMACTSLGIVIALSTGAGAQDASSDAPAILERYCAGCHGGPAVGARASRGGFGAVTNVDKLLARGLIVSGDPEQSELYQRIRDGEMPPASVAARPSAAEIEVVRAWIEAGPALVGDRRWNREQLTLAALADIRRLPARDRGNARYLSIGDAAGDRRALLVQAVSKLVNSLSWRSQLHRPVLVADALVRIDLGALGWRDETWEWLARRSPRAWASTDPSARRLAAATGTFAPLVSAEWFVTEASGPEAYHRLLELPATLEVLERRLGVEAEPVVRAGFNRSGVSRHNRLIERRPVSRSIDGYYWRSYDYAGSSGRRNLFEHPEGGAEDGGEVIFSLPNGLQGYFLVDAAGRRIERAAQEIVTDPGRPDRAVRNGVSCMGCHARGIISRGDELRAHVLRNAALLERRDRALLGKVIAEHPPADALEAYYARDRARFRAALARLGVDARREPIDAVAQSYDAELDLAAAAAELGLDAARFERHLGRARSPQLAALRLPGGTIKRDAWDVLSLQLGTELGLGRPLIEVAPQARVELQCEAGSASQCYALADRFLHGRGVPADVFAASRLYEQACERGLAAGCTAVGLLASRTGDGRGIEMFERGCSRGHLRGCERLGIALGSHGSRAEAAFIKGCAAGRADSCAHLGDMRYHGRGVTRELTRALSAYQRGCQRDSARACAHAGYMLENGLGARAETLAAARYTARACNLGRAQSCGHAGDLAFHGRGVARDRELAARYRQQACDGGVASSCRALALQLRWGQGAGPDWIRSERLFRRACNLGEQRACAYL